MKNKNIYNKYKVYISFNGKFITKLKIYLEIIYYN